jgi:hypothetical protein
MSKFRIFPLDNFFARWTAKNAHWLAPVIISIFVCLILLIIVVYVLRWKEYINQQNILQSEGIRVRGKVISTKIRGRQWIYTTHPMVEFFDHNSVKHQFESEYDFRCRVGDVVSVMYLPTKPEFAVIESAGANKYNVRRLIVMIAFLLFALFLAFCYPPYPLIKRIRKQRGGTMEEYSGVEIENV